MIRLTALVEEEGKGPRAFTYEGSAPVVGIGRDSKNEFQIPISTISRQHCKILFQDSTYLLEDLGSTHGTKLNGKKLAAGEKVVLSDGDKIELTKAEITCTIEQEQLVLAEPGEKTQAVAAKAVEEILGRIGGGQPDQGPFLRVLNGPDEGQRHVLGSTANEWAIGRSKECAFILNDSNVSRRHALVRKDWDGITIEDLGSKNGVIVNEKKIAKRKLLKHRDAIRIGPIKLLFIDPDHELMEALGSVPGLAPPEDEPDPEPPAESQAEIQPGDAAAAALAAPAPQPIVEEDEPPDVDPALLEPPGGGSLTLILLLAGGGVFALSLLVLLLIAFL